MPRRDDTVRESSGDVRPEPVGEWDGLTRAAALKALLAKHEEPNAPSVSTPRRWGRILGLAVLVLLALTPLARAQRLTPQEAADILRPNQFVGTVTYDGPTVVIAPYSGERYVTSDLDVYLSARFHRPLRRGDDPLRGAFSRSAYSASLGRSRDDWRRRGLPRFDASEHFWNLRSPEQRWRDHRPRSR